MSGPVHIINKLNTAILILDNRCQNSDSLQGYVLAKKDNVPIYYKRNSDNSVNVYTKAQNEDFLMLKYGIFILDQFYKFTPINEIDNNVDDDNLIKLDL